MEEAARNCVAEHSPRTGEVIGVAVWRSERCQGAVGCSDGVLQVKGQAQCVGFARRDVCVDVEQLQECTGVLIEYSELCEWLQFLCRHQVLAMGPGNLPAVRVLTGSSDWFSSWPSETPDLLCLGGFVTRTRYRTTGVWPGWNRTAVRITRFRLLSLQLSIWVLIISWHSQYVNCSALAPLSPPCFKFVIRLIFVEWLWNNGWFWAKLAGFRSWLNEYLSDCKSESGRWKSD